MNPPNTVQILSDLILDTRLSFYDKGVFAFLCYNAQHPTNISAFKPDEIRDFAASVRKLVDLGYIDFSGGAK